MTEQRQKKIIEDWFYENRPDVKLDQKFVDNIHKQIKDDIAELNNDAALLIIREYLRLNYSSAIFYLIEEVVKEEPFEKLFSGYKAIGFLYESEIGSIMNKIANERIVEKYGMLTYEELIDSEMLKEEIRNEIHLYVEKQKADAEMQDAQAEERKRKGE